MADSSDGAPGEARVLDGRTAPFLWVDRQLLLDHGAAMGPYGIAVYVALAWHARNADQTCYPSHKRLAEMIGVARRQVIREIHKLGEMGLIRVDKSSGRVHTYTLLGVATCDPQSHVPVTHSHTPCDPQSHVPVTHSHTNKKNMNKNKEEEEDNNNKGGTPPHLRAETDYQNLYITAMHRKRFATIAQKELIDEIVKTSGGDAYRAALKWAAEKGISNLHSIATRARQIHEGGPMPSGARGHNAGPAKPSSLDAALKAVDIVYGGKQSGRETG